MKCPKCPKCGGEMVADYLLIRSLAVASMIAIYNDNLKHAEDALLSTDARKLADGLRILKVVRDCIHADAERLIKPILRCLVCGHESSFQSSRRSETF